jgi:hypothetical protein
VPPSLTHCGIGYCAFVSSILDTDEALLQAASILESDEALLQVASILETDEALLQVAGETVIEQLLGTTESCYQFGCWLSELPSSLPSLQRTL